MDRELPIRKGNVVQATNRTGTVYNVLVADIREKGDDRDGLRGPYSVVGDTNVSPQIGLFPFIEHTMVVLG